MRFAQDPSHHRSGLVALSLLIALPFSTVAENFEAKIVDVSAGHIFEVRHAGQRELVVLYGVESPSSKTLAGKEAKRFATAAILKKQLEVRVVERRDGLTLVEIKLEDGRNLGHVMLRKGLVRWDSYTAPGDKGLQELEQLAKANHRGLWYPSFDSTEEPPEEAESATKDLLIKNPPSGNGYRVIEGRVITDETGVKTLVLRGNGEKQIGFEAAVVQRKLDAHLAYLAEMQRLERERLRQQEEAARRVAEQAQRNRQENLLLEMQRMLLENSSKRPDNGIRLRVWTKENGWQ